MITRVVFFLLAFLIFGVSLFFLRDNFLIEKLLLSNFQKNVYQADTKELARLLRLPESDVSLVLLKTPEPNKGIVNFGEYKNGEVLISVYHQKKTMGNIHSTCISILNIRMS